MLPEFLGDVAQQVPMTSAVKVDGERLYKKAHRGEVVETPVKDVHIEAIDVLAFDEAEQTMRCRIACSKGTYVRQLAIDIGEAVGAGGHLEQLARSATGELRLERGADALTSSRAELGRREPGDEHIPGLLAPARALQFMPGIELAAAQVTAVRNGARLPGGPPEPVRLTYRGELVAIYGPAEEGHALKLLVSSDARCSQTLPPCRAGRGRWPSAPSTACTWGTARSSAAPCAWRESAAWRARCSPSTGIPWRSSAPQHVPRMLSTLADKMRLIEELGPDELLLLTFDAEMAALPATDFCARLLGDALQARLVVVGQNFNFGARGAGDAALLRDCGAAHGYEVIVGAAGHGARQDHQLHAHPQAAARRRAGGGARDPRPAAVGRGPRHTRRAARPHPGRTYRQRRGPGRHASSRAAACTRPAPWCRARWYRAAVNIGHNPTFASHAETASVSIEAFLLGFAGDIYDQRHPRRLPAQDPRRAPLRHVSTTLVAADAGRHPPHGSAHRPGPGRGWSCRS